MDLRHGFGQLWQLIKCLQRDGIDNRDDAREWLQENDALVAELLEYQRVGLMPTASSLIQLDYHPENPLVLLNYTSIAHNTLYQFPDGWTTPLRLCRGTIFTQRGRLVGFGFPKFFNDGEHPETRDLPNDTLCFASKKHDGHLGIIYDYKGKRFVTTRGSFTSPTSLLAHSLLEEHEKEHPDLWRGFHHTHTLLAEIIHPETEILVDYKGEIGFKPLAITNARQLTISRGVGIIVGLTSVFPPTAHESLTLGELRRRVRDLNVKNQEGYVATLQDGRRIKFKYADYLSRMIGEKISIPYVMKRILDGDLETRIRDLDPEIQQFALELSDQVYAVLKTSTGKERVEQLLALDPAKTKDSAYRALCRRVALANL